MKPHTFLCKIVFAVLLTSLLAACGQRGALYLPEKGKPKKIKSSTAKKVEAVKPHGPSSTSTPATLGETPELDDASEEIDSDEQ